MIQLPIKQRLSFRGLSIATKLNLILLSIIVIVLGAAGTLIDVWLEKRVEERALNSLSQINEQIIFMVDAYASVLNKSAETVGAQFVASLPENLTLQEETQVRSGDLEAPELRYGENILNNHFDLVDRFTHTTGAVATIFVKKGDEFIRVSTSLKKENGERAIGTALDHQHPARQALLNGQSYTGKAQLFGRDYMTRYLPLKDATGNMIGVAFIGIDFTEGMKALKQKILAIRTGNTGYLYVISTGKDAGTAVIHPSREGQSLLGVKDDTGKDAIAEMLKQKNGIYYYNWPGIDGQLELKVAAIQSYTPWGWLIGVGTSVHEMTAENRTMRLFFLMAGLAVMLALALSLFFCTRYWVGAPLRRAVSITRKVAAGDLTVKVDIDRQDEVGKLLTASAEMCHNLREMVGDINHSVKSMSQEANTLLHAAEQATSTSGEQSTSANQIATSIEEVTSSMQQVSDYAKDTQEVAERFMVISNSGVEAVGKTIHSMQAIATTMNEASVAVISLGEQSERISSIVNVIREIAEQTNLLALNAAIEAARAGEAGRGFAVVADEVRRLSESTASATTEIESTILAIQEKASNAVKQMQDGLLQVEQGVELANNTGERIAEIRENTTLVGEAITGISQALQEQALVNQDVSQNVEHIAEQARSNYQQAENTSKAADDLRKMSEGLQESVSRFRC